MNETSIDPIEINVSDVFRISNVGTVLLCYRKDNPSVKFYDLPGKFILDHSIRYRVRKVERSDAFLALTPNDEGKIFSIIVE